MTEDVRERLQAALPIAMKARDGAAVAALRSALAAIGNAEAVDPGAAADLPAGQGHETLAGTVLGVGAAEVARRNLSAEAVTAIVLAEIGDREAAARQYDDAGEFAQSDRLRREAAVLRSQLAAAGAG